MPKNRRDKLPGQTSPAIPSERFNPSSGSPPKPPSYQLVQFEQQQAIQQHRGPLPHSAEIAAYEAIHPGAAKILFDNFNEQSKHRRRMERFALRSEANERMHALNLESKEVRLGQILAFSAYLLFIGLAFYAFYKGLPWAGSTFALVGIGGIVSSFISGRNKRAVGTTRESSEALTSSDADNRADVQKP